jgi:adenosylmethionine-8-amino-7-oxononanoate aminotransferase
MLNPVDSYLVRSAAGSILTLEDGSELVDGMSSWWSAIHGYNVPEINSAITTQLEKFSHIMFGGLTHTPAIELAERLLDITPPPLQHLFLADSGSIAIEVALKMALQFWSAQDRPEKNRFITIAGGYHGDTFATMALADPENGMHNRFNKVLRKPIVAPRPECAWDGKDYSAWSSSETTQQMNALNKLLQTHHKELAALILEPIVQGAGGMHFYNPNYLISARKLCDKYELLLITDEIATGFGRSGKMFAYEHTTAIESVTPDIMAIGKALTGGTMSLAATITTKKVVDGIAADGDGTLMHGPTFMGNPLACSAANASIDLLLASPWEERVKRIEQELQTGLAPCRDIDGVAAVRVLGAIGVVEMREPINMREIQPLFVAQGVWVRPFEKLVYLMPPYIISSKELKKLTAAVVAVLSQLQ